jgi:hypothetical protein
MDGFVQGGKNIHLLLETVQSLQKLDLIADRRKTVGRCGRVDSLVWGKGFRG